MGKYLALSFWSSCGILFFLFFSFLSYPKPKSCLLFHVFFFFIRGKNFTAIIGVGIIPSWRKTLVVDGSAEFLNIRMHAN